MKGELRDLAWILAILGAAFAVVLWALRADAARPRPQSVMLRSCVAPEIDEGEAIEVSLPKDAAYELVAQVAGLSRVLVSVPCAELPRMVSIGGWYPASTVCGRVSVFPGGCIPAVPRP